MTPDAMWKKLDATSRPTGAPRHAELAAAVAEGVQESCRTALTETLQVESWLSLTSDEALGHSMPILESPVGRWFLATLGPKSGEPRTLHVEVRREDARVAPSVSARCSLRGEVCGRFDTIEVSVDESSGLDAESIAADMEKIVRWGDTWLMEEVRDLLCVAEDPCARPVMRVLRRAFAGCPELESRVWPILVENGRAMHVVDESRRQSLMRELLSMGPRLVESPAVLILAFGTSHVLFDDSWSRVAIQSHHRVAATLSEAKYRTNRATLKRAQEVVFGTGTVHFLPIVDSGSRMLTAVYPASESDRITPLLLEHVSQFHDVVVGPSSLSLESDSLWRRVGLVVGGAVKAITHEGH